MLLWRLSFDYGFVADRMQQIDSGVVMPRWWEPRSSSERVPRPALILFALQLVSAGLLLIASLGVFVLLTAFVLGWLGSPYLWKLDRYRHWSKSTSHDSMVRALRAARDANLDPLVATRLLDAQGAIGETQEVLARISALPTNSTGRAARRQAMQHRVDAHERQLAEYFERTAAEINQRESRA